MFANLRELILSLPDEETCRQYLIQQRWNGQPVCPHCGYSGKIYNIENGKKFKCGSSACYKKFSCTVGTIFEASNIPLVKWFTAIYLITAHKKGISSYQLGRDIGISQKSAWFVLHRIRELMRVKAPVKLDNIVEVDETYIGGKMGNMSKSKRKFLRENDMVGTMKTGVMGLIERGGELKYVQINQSTDMVTMQGVVRSHVDTDALVITDNHHSYVGLRDDYAAHETINHTNDEYVRDKVFHTNSIEGAFSLLKRGIIGIYHQVTPKHLLRYCDEFAYRYNSRKIKDAERFTLSLRNVEGRLTYKALVNKPVAITNDLPIVPADGKIKPVVQLKDGKVINQFKSLSEAQRQTGIARQLIWRVLIGQKTTTGGFEWKYL